MKNTLIRAVRTWAQAFIGLLIASNVFGVDGAVDLAAVQVAAVSAIPAALALVQNWLESLDATPDYPRG